jgi:hypothetical protein
MNILVITGLALIVIYFIYNFYFSKNDQVSSNETLSDEPVAEEQPFIPETIKPKPAPRKRYNKKTAGKKPAAKTKK